MNHTLEQIEKACTETGKRFESYYLDWFNNFISVKGYADFYDLPIGDAQKRISIGRKIHKQNKG